MAKSAESEIQKMKDLENRISAPSYWGRVPGGIRFEDLQERRYEDAIRLIKKHYITEEITWRSVKIAEDAEARDEYLHNVRIWLKDKMSIAAVKEGTDKLIGVLVMRIQEKSAFSRTFSRMKMYHAPAYATVMTFFNELEEPVNIFDNLDVQRYLKIYIIAMKERYRHRSLTKEMIKGAMDLCRSGKVPAIAGIFQTSRLHQIGSELGFQKLNEIYYIRYLINERIVFPNSGLGNYGAALMAYRIPGVEEPQELKPVRSSRFSLASAKSREILENSNLG